MLLRIDQVNVSLGHSIFIKPIESTLPHPFPCLLKRGGDTLFISPHKPFSYIFCPVLQHVAPFHKEARRKMVYYISLSTARKSYRYAPICLTLDKSAGESFIMRSRDYTFRVFINFSQRIPAGDTTEMSMRYCYPIERSRIFCFSECDKSHACRHLRIFLSQHPCSLHEGRKAFHSVISSGSSEENPEFSILSRWRNTFFYLIFFIFKRKSIRYNGGTHTIE